MMHNDIIAVGMVDPCHDRFTSPYFHHLQSSDFDKRIEPMKLPGDQNPQAALKARRFIWRCLSYRAPKSASISDYF